MKIIFKWDGGLPQPWTEDEVWGIPYRCKSIEEIINEIRGVAKQDSKNTYTFEEQKYRQLHR